MSRAIPIAVLFVGAVVACKPAREAAPQTPRPIPQLQYVERWLGGATAQRPAPLIVALHGLGDRPESFIQLFDGFDRPARLIVPRGPLPAGPRGAAWFSTRISEGKPAELAAGIDAAASSVIALLDRLEAEGKTQGKPIVTGFSQGGMITLALAVRYPDRIGHAIPIGGWLPPPLWPAAKADAVRYPPIRALHGREDRVVPFDPADRAIRALSDLGIDARMIPFDHVGHQVPRPMQHTLFRMIAKALERTAATRTATVTP